MAVTVAQAVAKIEVQGDAEAKSKLQGMKGAVEETSGGFKGMLQNALNFAGGLGIFNLASSAMGFLKDQVTGVFQESMDAQAGMAQTEEVIRSTGGAAGMTAQQIADMAGNLSHLTTFSDDTIQSGENLLLTFTGIGKDVFPMATKTMLDMAQAMGGDVKSTAIQMGKALNDPAQGLTALTRVGVTFTDKQKEMITQMVAAGNTAGAQKIMLQELQREFGGSAEAAGKTFGGQLTILQQRISDVKQSIGDALMPILQNLMSWVSSTGMPLLEQFSGWFTGTALPALQNFGSTVSNVFSGVIRYLSLFDLTPITYAWKQLTDAVQPIIAPLNNAGNAFKAMGPTLVELRNDFSQLLVAGIRDLSGIITTIANAIKFLTGNSIQAQIVRDVLIGIGVAIAAIQIGLFVAAIPALVTGFIAWAVAAGSAAIATIAAALPIIAIGAVIAIVVAGIILAIQHWGQIVSFLQGVWGAFSSWFMGVLGAIGAFFHGVWNGIVSGLQTAWSFIINVVRVGAALLLAIVLGPILAIGAAFVWLYNHNYYFKALVDAIVGFFQGLFAWAMEAWQGFVGFLGGLWNGIVGIARAVWGAVSGAIMGVVSAVVGWLRSVWSISIGALGALWGTLSGYAQTAWNAVTGVFSSVWGTISGILGGLWNNISSWFSNLASQAIQWGTNLIQGFISGITNAAGAVGNAIAGVADKVKNFLGFHSPAKEGPGAEADVWAPNFVKMYAKGITDNIPLIHAAMSQIMKPISVNMGVSTNAGATQFPSMQSGSIAASNQPQNVYLQIDKQTFARLILPAFTDQVRNNVGMWNQ